MVDGDLQPVLYPGGGAGFHVGDKAAKRAVGPALHPQDVNITRESPAADVGAKSGLEHDVNVARAQRPGDLHDLGVVDVCAGAVLEARGRQGLARRGFDQLLECRSGMGQDRWDGLEGDVVFVQERLIRLSEVKLEAQVSLALVEPDELGQVGRADAECGAGSAVLIEDGCDIDSRHGPLWFVVGRVIGSSVPRRPSQGVDQFALVIAEGLGVRLAPVR